MAYAPQSLQNPQIHPGVILPQAGQCSLRQVPAGLDDQCQARGFVICALHMILRRWKIFLHFGNLHQGGVLYRGGAENPMVISFVWGAAVYSAAVVNTEGITQKQIKGVHLEEAVGNPPSGYTAGNGSLREVLGPGNLVLRCCYGFGVTKASPRAKLRLQWHPSSMQIWAGYT